MLTAHEPSSIMSLDKKAFNIPIHKVTLDRVDRPEKITPTANMRKKQAAFSNADPVLPFCGARMCGAGSKRRRPQRRSRFAIALNPLSFDPRAG
jgi:hypothetical protein